MSDVEIRGQVLATVQQYLGADVNESGAVLYNGWSSLRPGLLYLMGFNPGGDPTEIRQTVLKSVQELEQNYCAYDECWKKNHPADCALKECKGASNHQRRVRALLDTLNLGLSIKDVCATNAVFLRSKDQGTLKGSRELWEKCWPVHQRLLSIVQPNLILCLGNGDGLSAFSLLRSEFIGNPTYQPCGPNGFRDGKWFEGRVVVNQNGPKEHECKVIGIPHPSRYVLTQSLQEYLRQLGNKSDRAAQ